MELQTPKTDYTPAAWADVGWQPREIKAPGVLKVSDAIRIGKPIVGDDERATYQLCAMGCAWAGIHGRKMNDEELCKIIKGKQMGDYAEHVGASVGLPSAIAHEVNTKHCRGMSALDIADWLESKGY